MLGEVSLVLKVGVGKIPTRRQASRQDEDELCPVCDNMFVRGQPIIFTVSSRPTPIHIYRCRNKYYAALYLYYSMTAFDLVIKFNLSPRLAYRVQRIARSL